MTITHTFNTTGEAYDNSQSNEDIDNGDVLHIPTEGVVAVADTWPFAVTVKRGAMHGNDFEHPGFKQRLKDEPGLAVGIEAARKLACELGYPLVPTFSDVEREAMANADAHLNNAVMPNYTTVRDTLVLALDLLEWARKEGMSNYPGFMEDSSALLAMRKELGPKSTL